MTGIVLAALIAPQLFRLSNGIPVVVQQEPGAATIAIEAQVDLSGLAPRELSGMEIVAGAMFGESENLSLRAMQRLAWQIGGSVDSDVANDVLRLHIVTAKNQLQPAASFLCEALRRPTFENESLGRARDAVRRRLALLQQYPLPSAYWRRCLDAGVGATGFATVSKESAQKLHAAFVRPEHIAIAVVGDIDPDNAVRLLGGLLGGWIASEVRRPELPTCEPAPEMTKGFSFASASLTGPAVGDADFAAWVVLVNALGNGKGSSLNVGVRENSGWSYVNCVRVVVQKAKSVAVFAAVHSGATEATPKLAEILSGNALNVDRAKAYALGSYAVGRKIDAGRCLAFGQGHSTSTERAFWLAWWQMRAGNPTADSEFGSKLSAVTDADVKRVAERFLPSLVVVSDSAK